MGMSINTNVASLTAQRNSGKVQSELATAMGRLSSGLRINSAKDDAAGLAISERFTAQIRGLNQAARNANDAISLAQTAEGALGSTGSNLQRIRELAVQSANATNSSSDRAALQAEAAQLIAEIQRVGTQTEFNGVKLLDGSFTSKAFQVGANANETITVASIVDSRTSVLGSHSLTADGSITGNVVTAASGAVTNGVDAAVAGTNFTIGVNVGGVTTSTTPITYAANAGADAIATAINNAAGNLGVTATASNSATLSAISVAGAITFNLGATAVAATLTDVNDLSNLVSAINGVSGTTGITATFTSSTAKNSITLSTTDGRNIELRDYANGGGAGATVSFDGTTLTEGTAVSGIKTGTIALSTSKGAISTANANTEVFLAATNNSTFASLAAVDLSTVAGATSALSVVDSALSQINGGRADLGAVQNRFGSTIANLQTISENLSASRSRIQDADFAQETAALSRAQVLQQAATAMVAQANQLPQLVLQLLKS